MKTLLLNLKSYLFVLFLIMVNYANAQITNNYTSSGTFTPPNGVTTIQVSAYGAGGGGGHGSGAGKNGGGGGGGGGFSTNAAVLVVPNTTYNITIGSGGSGGSTTNGTTANGTNGSATTATFAATTITANGGNGGNGYSNGATAGTGGTGSGGTSNRTGGTGRTGATTGSGGGGGGAGTISNGGNGTIPTGGNAGGGNAGIGGFGTVSNNSPGSTGNNYGAAGGGGTGSANGADGADGYMTITYSCPTYSLSSPTTATGPLCNPSSSTITLSSNSLPSGTYTVTYTLSGVTNLIGTTATMTFTAGSPGIGMFSTPTLNIGTTNITITNLSSGSCNSLILSNNTASVSVTAAPTVVAGTSITTCANSGTINITAGSSASNYSSTLWTSSGTGTFTNATSLTTCTYTPSASDISSGSVILTLTALGNSPCAAITSNKTITINQIPTAIAGTAIATCSNTGAVNITNGSSATNYSSITWTSNGSGTFTNPNSLTSCTYTPSSADISAGSITVTLTVSNAGCSNATSTKNITIIAAATAVAGTAVSTCTTSGAVNITAGSSATNYSSVTWSSNGTGTFTNPNSLTTCTYTPSANDIILGSVTLTLTAAGNTPCSSAISTKILNIYGPTATAGNAITTCSTSSAINITSGSSASNYATVTWSSSGTGTFANINSLTTCTYNPSAADITAGTVTLTLTASSVSCGNDTSTKTLTIYTTPTINSTVPATRTGSGTVILGATPSAGTAYWYANATGGTALGFGTSFTTPTISTTTTFYVEAVNGPCSSSPRTAVVATVNYSQINVTGNSNTITNGSTIPSTTNWTDFAANNSTRTFTINNTGAGTLSISSVTISGTNAGDFSITTAPSSLVGSSASTTFVVKFNPSAAGVRNATISISNNDSTNNPYTFAIQGTGVVQGITIQGNSTTIANGSATPTTTNWTDFGSATATRTFTIINSGNVTLTIGAITLTGTNAGDFSVTSAPSATVGAYGSTTFTITFAPTAINIRTATVNVTNNDSTKNPYTFAIQGNGVIPLINIQGNATNITNGSTTTATTNWTDFSTTTITRTFTIFNNGNLPLTIGAISFSGANPGDFSVTSAPSSSVAAFSSTTFTVTFNPGATGSRTATISIVNNDSTKNPYTFKISGTGVVQAISVQGNATAITNGAATTTTTNWTDFSTSTTTRTFTIFNSGNMPLTVTGAITFTGTNAADFSITSPSPNTGFTVPAFGNYTFTVLFDSASGTKTATVRIPNSDSTKNPFTFAISATGGTTIITVTNPNGLAIADGDTTPTPNKQTDFGSVSTSSGSVTVTYTIQNTGTGAISLGAASFTGTNATDFSMSLAPTSALAPGASTTFEISFNPSVKGTKTATFSIVTNATGMNPFNFDITGLGVQTYMDTDGDGITDNIDLDDDNDGITDIQEQADAVSYPLNNLVQYTFLNETFGTGRTKGKININIPGASTTSCYEDNITTNANNCTTNSSGVLDDGEYCVNYIITNANGVSSDPENIHHDLAWTDQFDHTPNDTDGRMAIFNADNTAGTYFYQVVINGVLPNTATSFSFWVMNLMRQGNLGSTILPNITVEFRDITGNTLIASYNTGDIGRCSATNPLDNSCGPTLSNWLNYSTTVNLGNVTDFIIKIRNNAPGGGGNDFAMDDIVITQNYVDSDGDGVANIFDLDDENDGIPDIEEAGFKAYSSGLSRMDLSSSATWVDANGNGINDAIDSKISAGTYLIADTDGDGVPNYLDLDSDNDSFFDVDEAGILNGDGDINGDGKGDLLDADKDGILDLYDNSTGFGTTVRAYAKDTDTNGIPDYMQLDSNSDGIFDIQAGLYASLDANNDGKIDGSTDIDKDGILDTFDTNTNVIGSPRDLNRKLFLEFDGRNDYGQENAQPLDGLSTTSLMAWVDLNSAFGSDGVIVGQNNLQLRINSSKYLEAKINATVLTYSTTALNTAQWYHVGVTYNGTTLKLYLNGLMVASTAASGSVTSDGSKLTIGKDPSTATKYFKGKIDEIRIFGVALTDTQFQRMVYQEIQNTGSQVRGMIVPIDVGSLPFSNLLRYYRMDAYKDDVIDDLTTSSIDLTGMRIYNNKNIYVQQAPMPFVTERTGTFAVAVNSPTNEVRGMDIMDQDWSIVKVKHNITETANNIDLGMFVDPGIVIAMNNDTKIQNDWYLKLDGKIDLVGKSQLLQTLNSILDVTSAGTIERDQQGTKNIYNYNYWCSPVGTSNATTNNNSFTVAGVMKDGTTTTPQNITWTTGLDGSPTSPITLSSYWIFKFQNLTNSYANWATVGQNGTLNAAQGYTLKGSGTTTSNQNYTFVGKPNNGAITTAIAANNLNLAGNPYPSALDANSFITGNNAAITGSLYFWEHSSTNATHTLSNYQGGYSVRNLTGGTGPSAPAGINGLGASSKIPGRFIPVGQGFFIVGSAAGGNVTFNNNQRSFIKEDHSLSNTMIKNNSNAIVANPAYYNANDAITDVDTFKRVRLGLTSKDQYHRQILLGFMDQNASNGIDYGYDAPNIDSQPNDMYFVNSGTKLNIEGDGYFDPNNTFPIGIKTNVFGEVKIMVDATENLDANQKLYIFDNTNGQYHEITNEPFTVELPQGLTDNRFSLTFKDNNTTLANTTVDLNNQIIVAYTSSNNILNIRNNVMDTTVEKVSLYNMLGQIVSEFDTKNQNQQNIQLPIRNLSTGTYIVKVKTDKGDTTRKIVFN